MKKSSHKRSGSVKTSESIMDIEGSDVLLHTFNSTNNAIE